MEEKLKEIIVDKSSLEWIVKSNGLYIDKTKYILSLIRRGTYFFLSRPRRFGKRLLIDTLENIFKGNKELFKGTYIYDNYDFEEHPVIRLSLNGIATYDIDDFLYSLKTDILMPVANEYAIAEDFPGIGTPPSSWLSYLINSIQEKTGKTVVVLIDEYDYPLLDALGGSSYEAVKNRLDSFYSVLKPLESKIYFCFLTGVTRFQHVSIFSKLNNLTDISTDPEYAAICGYTDTELDRYFAPYMEKHFSENNVADDEARRAFRARMKEFYDGYRFSFDSPVTMYNPVSVGRFFIGGCRFRNFWIETGAQEIVNGIVRKYPAFLRNGERKEIGISMLSSLDVNRIFSGKASAVDLYSYLLQAGYLTIAEVRGGRCILDYPNLEVKDTMEGTLLSAEYSLSIFSDDIAALRRSFQGEDTASVMETFEAIYRNFPYDMAIEKERGYQIAFHAVLSSLSLERVEAEDKTSQGRADIAITVRSGLVYIIELKLDRSAEEALKQIKEKKYYEKYAKDGAVIHLLGINFSSAERNITEWKEEVLTL